ncbi:SON-like protein [Mya arenaria]|uniref:SON-like protein n=1 Tax=Mya arenaria TaxID=6604 RepID=A0ABY7FAE1_MYAAR|nr:SON-like protein [Mya arenaria]
MDACKILDICGLVDLAPCPPPNTNNAYELLHNATRDLTMRSNVTKAIATRCGISEVVMYTAATTPSDVDGNVCELTVKRTGSAFIIQFLPADVDALKGTVVTIVLVVLAGQVDSRDMHARAFGLGARPGTVQVRAKRAEPQVQNTVDCYIKCLVETIGDCYQTDITLMDPVTVKVGNRFYCENRAGLDDASNNCNAIIRGCQSQLDEAMANIVDPLVGNTTAYNSAYCRLLSSNGNCTEEMMTLAKISHIIEEQPLLCESQTDDFYTTYGGALACDSASAIGPAYGLIASNTTAYYRIASNTTANYRLASNTTANYRIASNTTANYRLASNTIANYRLASNTTANYRIASNTTANYRIASNTTANYRLASNTTANYRLASNTTANYRIASNTTANYRLSSNTTALYRLASTPPLNTDSCPIPLLLLATYSLPTPPLTTDSRPIPL